MKLQKDSFSFNFGNNLSEIYRSISSKEIKIVSRKNYFVSPFYCDLSELKYLENSILKDQNIFIGKFLTSFTHKFDFISEFTKRLMIEEACCVKRFFNFIIDYHEDRVSESRYILQFDHIRILIGEIIVGIQELEIFIKNISGFHQNENIYFARRLQNIGGMLAKLAGGRAFLSGSIIELLYTFSTINKIYLT
ncbi:MAG: hypothetical protein A3F10_00340 [Coxiella sp. RIFCSPHIGHO2_12_FULL_42_15]|nr:MAG: hypothetical protein A3F10_00340 [Coxiella sp. RIFCSPHIGHO2_12_FULL_42_15]